MVQTANMVTLKPQTLQAFEDYIREAEEGMQPSLRGESAFLELESQRAQQVRQGHVVAQLWSGDWPVRIPNGLIHDWTGAAFLPDVTVEQVLSLVQNYDDHKNIYRPEVIDSRLISREDNDFRIFLRLLKKKIITVVLDTDHDVHYAAVEAKRWFCRSFTTRIAEVEDAGTPKERVLEPDTGYGFLWRLNSYWKFDGRKTGAPPGEERRMATRSGDGVYIECRAISLTRDIPTGLGWIIEPIVRKLPQESLVHTLECTRKALQKPAYVSPGPKP
ncbi:MAG TPA: hypothetical protein VL240_01920 [Candidatus Binatia bacterium]|nr:hypothetical protein [Candidatus Binatia bacterium]